MPRKLFRKYLAHRDVLLARPWLAPFRRWLGHPNLWHLNRRSVAGAVAIGLFAGLVPGPLQMVVALLLAVPLRRNVPVALALTFYTNPFTIVPLYLLAYGYGRLLLPGAGNGEVVPFEWDWSDFYGSLEALWHWMLGLGPPLLVGLVALAVTLALLGYFAVDLFWRAYVAASWRKRALRRARER
ncbi:MAG TPA: DUF2062 domain-containing protein [Burkholderiales bacterium]